MSVALDLAAALDPTVLMRATVAEPDGWQADVLRSKSPRLLLNCSRQSGKSATTAVLGIHTATYSPGSLVLMLSPSQRQSRELFAKAMAVYRAMGNAVPSDVENRLELELKNGSRIVALPGKEGTIRGFSGATLILIDEASRVPDELYRSVRPMLAVSGGALVALSTPWGQRGWWYEAWKSGEGWERYEIPASMCPRISAAFLAEERRELGDLWFRSEYLCQFVDTQDAVFRSAEIDAALTYDIAPLFSVGG